MKYHFSYSESFPDLVTAYKYKGEYTYSIRIEVEADEESGMFRWINIPLEKSVWNRGAIISAIIRSQYSVDEVEATMNNVLSDPLDKSRMTEYKALQEWRKKAKEYAAELMAWADEHGIGDLIPQEEEEIYEATEVENKPDGILQLAQALSLVKSQAQELPDEQAAGVPALFPAWESYMGQQVAVGQRLFYAGRLWKVLQGHTVQADWRPDVVPALFTEVVVQQEGEPEVGTLDNPIPYNGNMELEEGKYYSQDGVVYRCIRNTGTPVYHDLSDLVGLYVQVVE